MYYINVLNYLSTISAIVYSLSNCQYQFLYKYWPTNLISNNKFKIKTDWFRWHLLEQKMCRRYPCHKKKKNLNTTFLKFVYKSIQMTKNQYIIDSLFYSIDIIEAYWLYNNIYLTVRHKRIIRTKVNFPFCVVRSWCVLNFF